MIARLAHTVAWLLYQIGTAHHQADCVLQPASVTHFTTKKRPREGRTSVATTRTGAPDATAD